MYDDVAAAERGIDCLVDRIGFGIGAQPYLDGEYIRLASHLVAVLGNYPEDVEPLAVDGTLTLVLGIGEEVQLLKASLNRLIPHY